MNLNGIFLRGDDLMRKRFPTLLGLVLLIVGVVAGIVLVGRSTGGFLPRASAEFTPQQVRITNITDSSFTVSFLTQQAATSVVKYGTDSNSLKTEARDDRDQLNGQTNPYLTHYITVRSLQPQTQYSFQLVMQGNQVFDNNGDAFTIRTARSTQAPVARSAYGTIQNQAGSPATGALVYLTTAGGSPLSSYVKQDGSWSIPLAQLRTQDLSANMTAADETSFSIQIVGQTTSETINLSAQASQLMPLETLQFGKPLPDLSAASTDSTPASGSSETSDDVSDLNADDILGSDDLLSDNPIASDEADSAFGGTGSSFASLLTDQDQTATMPQKEVTISFPSENAEQVSSTKPELSGKAPPGATLQIVVHSTTPYYGVVTTDASGDWNWTPPADLEPGSHSITVTYTNASGQQVTETRNFLVMADSTLPAFESTPSAKTTPSPLAQASPKASPKVSPKPSPIVLDEVSPSPIPSASPQALPVTADSTPLFLFASVASGLIGLGLFARARKQSR